MLNERTQKIKGMYCIISLTENSRKYKLICHGIKQISGCLEMGKGKEGHKERITKRFPKRHQETFGSDEHIHYLFFFFGGTGV
jgi:hypothetical protein